MKGVDLKKTLLSLHISLNLKQMDVKTNKDNIYCAFLINITRQK